MSPLALHEQETIAERREPLSMENKHNYDQRFRISTMMKGAKFEGQLLDDFHRRSSPIMMLPKLPMSSSSNCLRKNTTFDSPVSVIDEVLDVIDYDYTIDDDDEENESEDDVTIVPVKIDNYVNKRSRLSRTDKRRRELLLDNGSAITDALRALENTENPNLSSEDEESLDPDDIDDGYDSD